jgi:DNA polymerase-3 subunit epsilon
MFYLLEPQTPPKTCWGESTANVLGLSPVMGALTELDVIAVDCQATAAAPRGHLLEIAWVRWQGTARDTRSCLIRLPAGERVPSAVTRITGISTRAAGHGVEPHVAWRQLLEDAAGLAQKPAPAVIHFARFEYPFLSMLARGSPPLDIVCTHEIARRVLPTLPRRSLRALAGYFGRDVGLLRRSASHVEATAFVWRELIPLLQQEGITTWSDLRQWLAAPLRRATQRRVWPLSRDVRLAVPDAPGVYRMHRKGGDVLYVGKSSSLHHRVNSYFQKQSRVPERMLEMLSQVRAISFEVSPSPLEAALLEPDEIKRLHPPYNVALVEVDRVLRFAAPDLSVYAQRPSPLCPLGPFSSTEVLDAFSALATGSPAALGRGRYGPGPEVFTAGRARFVATHREFERDDISEHLKLLHLGTRLWREGRRDHDDDEHEADSVRRPAPAWTSEQVQRALEWVALRASLARRRAKWLTRLCDATVVWSEPGASGCRLIVIENGDITAREDVDPAAIPPVPSGWARSTAARRAAFTVARFDRLRVLTTELKRVVAAGASVSLRLGAGPALANTRLARVLSWL